MKQDEDSRGMVSTDRGQDSDLSLKIQDSIVPEDNLSIMDQGEMRIVIDRDQSRKFHSLHKLLLSVLDVDAGLVTKSEPIVKRSRRS